jgi:hypothetical protein
MMSDGVIPPLERTPTIPHIDVEDRGVLPEMPSTRTISPRSPAFPKRTKNSQKSPFRDILKIISERLKGAG